MMKKIVLIVSIIIILVCSPVEAQTTEFTYQGSLRNASVPAGGNYDFEFALFDAVSGGTQIGSTVSLNSVEVTDGIFSVNLNFGANFPGANRYLEIHVRQTGGGAFTTLTPRQTITSTPYAVKSLNAENAVNATNATQLGGVNSSQFVQTTDSRLSDSRNPLPSSSNYIQNIPGVGQQTASFNITGGGSANIFNASVQFNIGGNRVLSVPGTSNVFAGVNSGNVNTGANNSFFGTQAGFANTTANNNSFFGFFAGQLTNSGANNSFFGSTAGQKNTTGGTNSFFGLASGNSNTGGNSNAFFGSFSGQSNLNGGSNAFFGHRAGEVNTDGSENAFYGSFAGQANTTGFRNTLIGGSANVGSNNLNNATAIGANALVSLSNSLVLGNNVNVGIGTSTPTYKLQIIDSSNTGLRVQTDTTGGTLASFGGNGAFQIDAFGIVGGRLSVKENGNVGIGTNNPNTKLQVTGGSVFITNPNSLIITSPNGACWFITVNNAGALTTISVPCP
jgi:hypothetical protein